MNGFSGERNPLEFFFLACSVIGGGLFLLRFIIQMAGGHSVDLDRDLNRGHRDVDCIDTDEGFRLFSLHGLTSFFMMFGLVGLVMLRANHAGSDTALVCAIVAGVVTVCVIDRIFVSVKGLESDCSGHNADAIGERGAVFCTIRPGGKGKVQLSMQGRLWEFEAVSRTGEVIGAGEGVVVTDVNGNVLVVEKA